MLLFHISLVTTTLCFVHALPRPQSLPQQPSRPAGINAEAKQLLYVPQRQQYSPELQYDLSLLDPQFQVPAYNFIGDKQPLPRVQPQIILYHGGGAPGQSFLLQPGSPPGNFLLPQPGVPGPNVVLRDVPGPPRPVFVAGYPKPAHIPPIEKDAEEIPTNPSKIPPLKPNDEKKPEKLETFDEDDNTKKTATEADVLAEADRNPSFNPRPSLRPGQRFFILNGQPLFTNFPYNNQIYPGINVKYAQTPSTSFIPQFASKNISPLQNSLFRSAPVESNVQSHRLESSELQQVYPENLVLLNQPGFLRDSALLNHPVSFEQAKDEKAELRQELKVDNRNSFRILADSIEQDDDSVVIDAKEQLNDGEESSETEAEVVSAADKFTEPTISQAQPGAIALAGPGGIAAAAPRGTAFVGREGVAVSSPQATAVAGPREETKEEKNKKPMKRRQ